MERKPKFIKTFFGTLLILVVVYFSVYTLKSNEEIAVTDALTDIPLKVVEPLGVSVTPYVTDVDIDVKGTREMMKQLRKESINVLLLLEEKEEEDSEEVEQSSDTKEVGEEEVNLKDKYVKVLKVEGLDGYMYEVKTDVDMDVSEVEGEKVNLKVKLKGTTKKEIEDIKILSNVTGYFTEEDNEQIEDVSVYVDLDNLDADNMVAGEIRIKDVEGEYIDVEGKLDKNTVGVEVVFKKEG